MSLMVTHHTVQVGVTGRPHLSVFETMMDWGVTAEIQG